MILVHAARGLVIELAPSAGGKWDQLSVRVGEGAGAVTMLLEVSEGAGGLRVRPTAPHTLAELTAVLAALQANESRVLPEVRKYAWH